MQMDSCKSTEIMMYIYIYCNILSYISQENDADSHTKSAVYILYYDIYIYIYFSYLDLHARSLSSPFQVPYGSPHGSPQTNRCSDLGSPESFVRFVQSVALTDLICKWTWPFRPSAQKAMVLMSSGELAARFDTDPSTDPSPSTKENRSATGILDI